jgi:TPR repeat protein
VGETLKVQATNTLKLTLNFLCFFTCIASVIATISFSSAARSQQYAQELEAVQVYSQDELIKLINTQQHLSRIKADRCQIVEDIEARADIMHVPAFQFLWGDMLAWGVCVEKNPVQGIYYIREAANQGLMAALEQLGRYYSLGTFVQEDKKRAVMYLREAAAMGNLSAQLQLADLFLDGHGSPYDFKDLYHWLYNAVTDNSAMHRKIKTYMQALETKMHPKDVSKARRPILQ